MKTSKEITEEDVRSFFSECGEILGVRIPKNQEGEAKGVVFVSFATEANMDKAVELNGNKLKDFVVEVERSHSKGERREEGKERRWQRKRQRQGQRQRQR